MEVNVKNIVGNWHTGYVLDKHSISSQCVGHNAQGHPMFDTTRTPAGEALYQLKYQQDWQQAPIIAEALAKHILPRFDQTIDLLIPMPPSKRRPRQPVLEITQALGVYLNLPVFDRILIKTTENNQVKNAQNKSERISILKQSFTYEDQIRDNKKWNVLLIDDLYDTGASMEVACETLQNYEKIANIYVSAVTWK